MNIYDKQDRQIYDGLNVPQGELDQIPSGRYRIERVIEVTGFHTVYGAIAVVQGQPVVIKEARQELCEARRHGPACFNLTIEGAMLRLLQRHTIPAPQYIDHFHRDGRACLVMSPIPGQTIEVLHQEGRLSPCHVVDLMLQVCGTIQLLHELGFVYGDVKPTNIIVRPDGFAVVIDYSSTQRIRAPGDCRPHGSFTPGFASPEQIRGEARPGNDIFSLGKTLEMLIPWPGRRLAGIIGRSTAAGSKRYATICDFQRDLARLNRLDSLANLFGLMAI
jgi:serine/threonine protein kinase